MFVKHQILLQVKGGMIFDGCFARGKRKSMCHSFWSLHLVIDWAHKCFIASIYLFQSRDRGVGKFGGADHGRQSHRSSGFHSDLICSQTLLGLLTGLGGGGLHFAQVVNHSRHGGHHGPQDITGLFPCTFIHCYWARPECAAWSRCRH